MPVTLCYQKELEPWPNNWGMVKDLEEIPNALLLSVMLECDLQH